MVTQMTNKPIYMCFTKSIISEFFHPHFTCDIARAAETFISGGRVFKLPACMELNDIEITYLEKPLELT